jgi:hydroxylaminobenzene mutase
MEKTALLVGQSGFALFTLSLMIGAFIPKLRNPRMGLSAHLTAGQSGVALMVSALFWPHFGLSAWAMPVVGLALVLSCLVLTLGIVIAAATGASRSLPLAGQGYSATKPIERLVSFLTVGSSVALLLACFTICIFMFNA